MGLPRLDVVLRLAAGAIDVLVDGAAGTAVEAGDDEAGVDALRPGFDAGDDAFDAVPARGAVVEFLEPPQLSPPARGEARRRCSAPGVDMPAQRGGRRDAEGVVERLARQKRSTSGVQ